MVSERQKAQSNNVDTLPELIRELHKAWEAAEKSGSEVNLREVIEPKALEISLSDLHELIRIDLDLHIRKGRNIRVERYFLAFPHLVGTPYQLHLISEEYQLRQKHGDRPALGSYRERFPELIDELIQVIYNKSIAPMARTIRSEPETPKEPVSNHSATLRDKDLPGNPEAAQNSAIVDGPAMSKLYRLIRPLGSGTFGEVWLAEAPGGVEVAIKKLLRTVNQAEGRRELQVLEMIKGLRHPFLLQIHSYWQEEGGRLCIVMDLADGSLRDRYRECREQGKEGIPKEELIDYFRESAEALDYLHRKKIQHRDIKPENILLLQGHAKLADFGLARQSQGHEGLDMSVASFCGSPHYIAPEVWAQQVSPQSDQYSLAVSYVELRTGQRPFHGDNFHDIMFAHLEGEPDLRGLTRNERTVLRKALDKDPANRYSSCREFLLALSQDKDITSPEPPERGSRKWTVILLLLFVLLGGAGGFSAWYFGQGPSEPTKPEVPPKKALPLPSEDFQAKSETPGPWPGTEKLYEVITVRYNGAEFRFRVIPGLEGNVSIRPFYMLEGEVSVEQFQAVALAQEYGSCLGQFPGDDPDLIRGKKPEDWKSYTSNKDFPARGMTVAEAHCFCEALTQVLKLKDWKIRLPDSLEWLRAAGYYDRKEKNLVGPFPPDFREPGLVEFFDKDNPHIAVGGREEPLPVGRAIKDVSIYGCRDMAGNLLEWTRTILNSTRPGLPTVPPPDGFMLTDKIALVSREYTRNNPLLFDNPKRQAIPTVPGDQAANIGFRILLEIPKKIAEK